MGQHLIAKDEIKRIFVELKKIEFYGFEMIKNDYRG